MRGARFRIATAVATLLLLSFAGCGGDRAPVYGEVTLDNKPLAAGTIKFVPTKNVSGPTVATTISDGQYSFGRSDGPAPGLYSVEIYCDEAPPAGLDDPEEFIKQGGKIAVPQNTIAPRYNKATTLQANVDPQGELKLDFATASGN